MTEHPVVERMTAQIARWEEEVDRRCIFLSCYAAMSRNMAAAIERGEFHDGSWMETVLQRFAAYYFDALDAYERSDPTTPMPWRVAHDAARMEETMTLQHLFLGINAHINFDLVLTLDDVLREAWDGLSPGTRRARYEDHCRVNAIIAKSIDAVQDGIVERWTPALDIVDRTFGRLDEWALSRLIVRWRDQVWENAQTLLRIPHTGERRAAVVGLFEAMAFDRANAVLLDTGLVALRRLL